MKYSFILEIDDISKDDINELVNILSDNKIKFHVLKSDKELKENQKYKEVINKAIDYINSNPNVYYDEHLIDVETLKANETTDKFVGEVKFISKLLSILKEVEDKWLKR